MSLETGHLEVKSLRQIIFRLISSNRGLVDFLSDLEKLRLSMSDGEAYWWFCKEEQQAIRTSLEFWTGSGRVVLAELLKIIDDEDLRRILRAIVEVRDDVERG